MSGYRGIVAIANPAAADFEYFDIVNNTFDGTASPMPMAIGVQTNTGATFSRFNNNTFTNISESAAADVLAGGTTGYGVILSGNILVAHGNQIHDNDNGMLITSALHASFDFSSDGDPDNANALYCNSKPSGSASTGYDLVLS